MDREELRTQEEAPEMTVYRAPDAEGEAPQAAPGPLPWEIRAPEKKEKKRAALSRAFSALGNVFGRFPFTALFLAAASAILAVLILEGESVISLEKEMLDALTRILAGCGYAALFSAGLKMLCMGRKRELPRWAGFLVCFLLPCAMGAWIYVILDRYLDSDYLVMVLCGIAAALAFFFLFSAYFATKGEGTFASVVGACFVAGLADSIAVAGLELALYAFDSLVLGGRMPEWIYILAVDICAVFLAPMVLLSRLPLEEEEDAAPSKTHRVLIGNIGIPVYLLLIAVLYIYFIKIAVTLTMPEGRINWFASFALLFFVFFRLQSEDLDTGPSRFLTKYGAWLMLPVIGMQILALVIRLRAYGLTTVRWYSLVCTGLGILFVLASLLKEPPYRWIVLVCVAAALVTTGTGWNGYDVSAGNQTDRLTKALEAEGMWKDGAIVRKADPSPGNREIILDSAAYLSRVSGRNTELGRMIRDRDGDLYELFGIREETPEPGPAHDWRYVRYAADPMDYDITGYSTLSRFEVYVDLYEKGSSYDPEQEPRQSVSTGDDELYARLQPLLEKMLAAYDAGESLNAGELAVETKRGRYVFTELSFEYYGEETDYYYVSGSGMLLSGFTAAP